MKIVLKHTAWFILGVIIVSIPLIVALLPAEGWVWILDGIAYGLEGVKSFCESKVPYLENINENIRTIIGQK